MRKGISPLVAAVLLIAVTMTIAGMLAYWASSFVRSRVEQWEQEAPITECSFANFRVYSCSYDSTTLEMSLILENFKRVELKNLTVYVFYPTSIANKTLTEPLSANVIKSFTVTGVNADYTTITIKTHCSEISASSTCGK